MSGLRPLLCAALASGVLSACAVGPDYAPPPPPAPQSGTFVSPVSSDAASDEPPANWWQLYNTPAIDRLVQAALTHNKNLLMAAANLVEARAALSQARAGQFPSTTLSAGAQYGVSQDQAFANHLLHKGPASPETFYSAGLDASYEVDLWGQVRRAIESASANYEAQKAAEDVVRITVAGETTRAYVDACAYGEEFDVAKHSLDVVTQSADITERQVRDGTASDFDLARARELVAQTRATLPTYEGQRRTALFQLAVLTGQPPEEISSDADACRVPPKLSKVLPIGDVKGLFQRRPDVREAERQLAANVAQIGVETANLYPTITIGASASTGSSTIPGLTSISNFSYALARY